MKKVLQLILMFLVAFTLNAQNAKMLKSKSCCGNDLKSQLQEKAKMPEILKKLHNDKGSKSTRVDTITCYDWVVTTSSWVKSIMEVKQFDTNGITEMIRYTWNGSMWYNNSRDEYIYDVDGFLTEMINYSWSGGTWLNMNKTIFNYDGQKLDELIEQVWNVSNWENSSQYFYDYDGMMNLTEILENEWNGSAWDLVYKHTYTYDGNFQQIGMLKEAWDGSGWIDDQKGIFTYDAYFHRIEEVYQWWNGAWENSDRFTYEYDTNGFQINETFYYWDQSLWQPYLKDSLIYGPSNRLIEKITYQWSLTVWENFSRCLYTYYQLTVGIDDNKDLSDNIKIYPIPAKDCINISSDENISLQIVNINGQVLHSGKYNGSNKIDISYLPEGLYFIHVYSDDKRAIYRFVKL